MATEERWPMVDMVSALADALRQAQERGHPGSQDALVLKECTVQLAMSWDSKAEGGVEFWVVKLGGSVSKGNTETITLVLQPGGGAAAAPNTADTPG